MADAEIKFTEDIAFIHFSFGKNQDGPYYTRKLGTKLKTILKELEKNPSISAVIFQSAVENNHPFGRYDAVELLSLKSAKDAYAYHEDVANILKTVHLFRKSTVCLIEGPCTGFFFELALACRYRIASKDPKTAFFLEEIQLGLVPTAITSKVLYELIGLQAALDLVLTGRKISASKALAIGLVHTLSTEASIQYLAKKLLIRTHASGKDTASRWIFENNPLSRKMLYKKAKDLIDEKTSGFLPSSYKALDLVCFLEQNLNKNISLHAQIFSELLFTRQSQCLLYAAYIGRTRKDSFTHNMKTNVDEMVGLIGSDGLGAEIAISCIDNNLRVRLFDKAPEAIALCFRKLSEFLSKKTDKKLLSEFDKKKSFLALSADTEFTGFRSCSMVIDASAEDLSSKFKVINDVQSTCQDKTILAISSVAISVRELQRISLYPEKVIGMRFFAPAQKNKVVEIVATEQTAQNVSEHVISFALKLGKIPVLVNDGPGFYSTRVLAFYLAEALQILFSGNSIGSIDIALKQFGFTTGPFALIDEIGIDNCLNAIAGLQKNFKDRLFLPSNLNSLLAEQHLGRKNFKGFYTYSDDLTKCKENEQIYRILNLEHHTETVLAADEIAERCLHIFANESAACLRENIVQTSADVDLLAIYALGFPAFWGGPLKYIDVLGINRVIENLLRLEQKFGKRYHPDPLLLEYAKSNRNFSVLSTPSEN